MRLRDDYPCWNALSSCSQGSCHLGQKEIPQNNILKRWTKQTGSTVDTHPIVSSLGGMSAESETYMHNALWLAAAKLVENGKTNMEAFGTALSILNNGGTEVQQLTSRGKTVDKENANISRSTRRADWIEVYQGYNKQDAVPMELSCPPRIRSAGRPNSSSLKSWKEANKKKVHQNRDAVRRMQLQKQTRTYHSEKQSAWLMSESKWKVEGIVLEDLITT